MSEAVPSSVPSVDLCASLKGAIGGSMPVIGVVRDEDWPVIEGEGPVFCGDKPGELGREDDKAAASFPNGSDGTDGLGTKMVFRSLRPRVVLFLRGVADYEFVSEYSFSLKLLVGLAYSSEFICYICHCSCDFGVFFLNWCLTYIDLELIVRVIYSTHH